MFALFTLSPIEIIILLGTLLFGVPLLLIIVFLNRSKPTSEGRQFSRPPGQPRDDLDDEVNGLRSLVRMQQEEIAALKREVKELAQKVESRGSTDITT